MTTLTPPLPAPVLTQRGTRLLNAATFQMDFAFVMLQLAIPLLAISLQADVAQLGLLGALQRILFVVASPLGGRLSDFLGRRAVALSGALGLGLISLGLCFVSSLELLFWMAPLVGFTAALFWPPIQAWLSDFRRGDALQSAAGDFNVAWSVGALGGTFAVGFLMDLQERAPFGTAALFSLLIFLCVLIPPAQPAAERRRVRLEQKEAQNRENSSDPAGLYAGWLILLAPSWLFGFLVTLFPKQASDLGYSAAAIGAYLAVIGLSRTLVFALFARLRRRWGLSAILWVSQSCGLAAIVLMVLPVLPPRLLLAFTLYGVAYAAAFSNSQWLSLQDPAQAGQRIGIHEALMLMGIVSGSFCSGLLAHSFGIPAAYGMGVVAAAAIYLVSRPAGSYLARRLPSRVSPL